VAQRDGHVGERLAYQHDRNGFRIVYYNHLVIFTNTNNQLVQAVSEPGCMQSSILENLQLENLHTLMLSSLVPTDHGSDHIRIQANIYCTCDEDERLSQLNKITIMS
jgi:hypothetical protein